jgi:hypothetical protein
MNRFVPQKAALHASLETPQSLAKANFLAIHHCHRDWQYGDLLSDLS